MDARLFRRARPAQGLLALLLAALGAACDHSGGASPSSTPLPPAALKLAPMSDCSAYKSYVSNTLVQRYTPSGWRGGVVTGDPVAAPVPASDALNGSAEGSMPDHVSGTNNQEAGVDEADIVKTDSKGTLYIAHGTTLRIVAGHPASELRETAALDLGAAVTDLHVDEARARIVAFAVKYMAPPVIQPLPAGAGAALAIVPPYYAGTPVYRAMFIDAADPAAPVITAQLEFDGAPRASRRIDGRIHAVLANPIDLPDALNGSDEFWKLYWSYYETRDADAAAAIAGQIRAAITSAVAAADAGEFLPRVTTKRGAVATTAPLVDCTGIQSPRVQSFPTLVTVVSFDTDAGNLAATSITAHAAVVYATARNLYLAQSSANWWAVGPTAQQTGIHKFAIDGATPVYRASGVVDGWVPDAFALGEHGDELRVVTHSDDWSAAGRESSNHLFVLTEGDAGELRMRGSVRGFGANENLYSVRFVGTRGFAVTFRRVDPLFAFDLTDPDNPKRVGELTIPGFSDYMHPLGDTHLLTIGRDGDWQVQLQVFDVSDMSAPRLAHKYAPVISGGYSWSDASYDHHAFMFDATTGTLAIPLSYYNYLTGAAFNGIVALNVDTTAGFREIVRVDHADLAVAQNCGQTLGPVKCGVWNQAYPRRAVLMTAGAARTLYTVSNAGVKATDLGPPNATLGSVVFPPLPGDVPVPYDAGGLAVRK